MTPLFFQRRFWPMWTALSLGAFNDNLLRQALIIGISFGWIKAGGFADPDDAIPIIGSFFAIAMLIFSSFAGQVAEKHETAKLFRLTKFAEVLLMGAAGVGFLLNSGWMLIATLFAMGAQSAFFSPVRQGAMPKYLAPQELIRGNGLCNAGLYVSILIGLFLGGLMIASPNGRMTVAATLFAASLAGFIAALAAPRAAASAPDLKLDWNAPAQALRIARFAFAAPGVGRPILGWAFFFYIATFITVLTPLYARDSLGAGEGAATAIMGVFAIGAGLGGLAAAALSRRRSGLGWSTFGIAAAALSTIMAFALTARARGAGGALFQSTDGILLAGAFCASAMFMGLYVAPLQAAIQRRAPRRECARILAAGNMINAGAAMLGSLSVLVVTRANLDPAHALLGVAALQGAVALYMRRRRRLVAAGLYDEALVQASVENERAAELSSPGPA
jgi:MFS family permease